MLLWYWIYKDQPQEIFSSNESSPRAVVVACFDEAARFRIRDGRIVSGMWLIEGGTEQDHVIRIFGMVPSGIRSSHDTYVANREAEPGLIRLSDPSQWEIE